MIKARLSTRHTRSAPRLANYVFTTTPSLDLFCFLCMRGGYVDLRSSTTSEKMYYYFEEHTIRMCFNLNIQISRKLSTYRYDRIHKADDTLFRW